MSIKVYNPDSLMLLDAVIDDETQCPRCGRSLRFICGYDVDESGWHLVAALIKEPCCPLTEDEVDELKEEVKGGYERPEMPVYPM